GSSQGSASHCLAARAADACFKTRHPDQHCSFNLEICRLVPVAMIRWCPVPARPSGSEKVKRARDDSAVEIPDHILITLGDNAGDEGKQELEKSLKLSRKLRKELNSLTEWLAATDAELTKRLVSYIGSLCPQATQKQTEKHAPQLSAVVELAEALKAVLRGQESLVDDKVQLLNCNWVAVTSRSEERRRQRWRWSSSTVKLRSGWTAERRRRRENLKEEDFTVHDGNCEEGAVKELLLKGQKLQRRVPDQDKKEEIRIKHNQLNTKYNTVMDLRGVRRRKALAIAPQWYQYHRKTDDLLQWLDDIERSVAELPDPVEEQREIGSEFDEKSEDLKEVQGLAKELSDAGAASLVQPRLLQLNTRWQEELQESVGAQGGVVAGLNAAGKEIIGQSTQEDGAQIRLQLNTLNTRWVNITQELAERKR
ncbi:unnamed protein product, partial [Coregonus sp. 'balchen']